MSYGNGKSNILEKAVKYVRSECKELQLYINNRKIKSKTFYLYVFCVLVPVLVTNIIIMGNFLKAFRAEEKKNINNIADAVAHDISSSFESAVYVTVDLYASSSIRNFLDTKYKSQKVYLQEYNKVFNNYMFYASSKHLLSGITLYSDNLTMISGGRYYRIETIHSEEWYKKFLEADQDLIIYPYYDDNEYDKKRMLSVIRKLNYNELSNTQKIAKLDFNYNMLYKNVKSSACGTTVYVCYENKILFTNDKTDRNLKKDYMDKSMIPLNKVQVHKGFTAYGFNFDIYLKDYKSNNYEILRDYLWLIAVLLLADALIPAAMLTLFSNSITKRILLLGSYLKKVKGEEFEQIPKTEGKDEIGELLDNYNLMVNRMKVLIESEYKSKLEQQELHLARQQAELLALHSQINPHFMFNVLESIRMRSVIKGESETSQMIESLARLMRKSAEWGADLITIGQELEFTEDYLNLQKYRFGDDFNYKFHINKEYSNYLIPSLALVTFVENACVHGLNREEHSGTIFVSVYEENAYLYIEVEDTGIGMEEEQVQNLEITLNEANISQLQKSSSLGMLNACIRLKKYCGNQTEINIESEKRVGTCIIIKIPIENLKKK